MATSKTERKKLITPVFRLSFPNLFVARVSGDDPNAKPKFGCSAIWSPAKFTDKEKVQWRAIIAEMDTESKNVFRKAWKDLDPSVFKKGIRDGAAKEDMEGYGQGTRFANLTTKNRPGVVDRDGETDISPEEGNAELIYPGCFCRATVQVYSFTKKGKGVALGLRNIQKVKDGPRLDNRVAAKDDFDEEIESAWLDQEDDADAAGAEDEDEIPF